MSEPKKEKKEKAPTATETHTEQVSDEQLEGRFKSIFGFGPSMLLQPGAQVYLRKIAEWLGLKARRNISNSSFLRSDIMEFIAYVGALKIEVGGSMLRRVIGEFVAAFAQSFCGGEGEDDAAEEKVRKAIPPEYLKAVMQALVPSDVEWLKQNDALRRLVPADKRDATSKLFEADAEDRWNERQILLYGPPKKPESKKPGVPLKKQIADIKEYVGKTVEETLEPVNRELEQSLAKLEAFNRELELKNQARRPQKPTLLEKFFRWASK